MRRPGIAYRDVDGLAGQMAGARLLARQGRIHVIALAEIDHPAQLAGYRLYRAAAGAGAEARRLAVWVLNDVEVKRVRMVRMRRRWWGPFRGIPHDGRAYWVLVVRFPGMRRRTRVVLVHLPPGGPSGGRRTKGRNAPAWWESWRWLVRFARMHRRVVIAGDLNATAAELTELLTDVPKRHRGRRQLAGLHLHPGTKVEHALTKGVRVHQLTRGDRAILLRIDPDKE